ncbi:MAG: hypothetical protein JO076_14615 [Verrucomicrobia bacterium]|nr:hypothetical protein [Verrucomicrobiota bacterium]
MVSRISASCFSGTIRPICGKSAIISACFKEQFTISGAATGLFARDELTRFAQIQIGLLDGMLRQLSPLNGSLVTPIPDHQAL